MPAASAARPGRDGRQHRRLADRARLPRPALGLRRLPRRPDAELWRLGDARTARPRAPAPAPISASTRSATAPDGRAPGSLTHGTTLHGIQNLRARAARRDADLLLCPPLGRRPRAAPMPTPCSAPGRGSAWSASAAARSSCYARPDQSWTFFEIDPAMVEVARNRFTFLSRCAPQARIVLGDARLSLARAAAPTRSTSSPSTPSRRTRCRCTCSPARRSASTAGRCSRDGIVLFHISNRYLDLKPVIADLAARERLDARRCCEYVPDERGGGAERHHLGLDRLVARSGDDRRGWSR